MTDQWYAMYRLISSRSAHRERYRKSRRRQLLNDSSRCGKKNVPENLMSRNYTVYAVDFDGTLCESIYPGIGAPNMGLILHLIKRRNQGNKVILWTCRCGQQLTDAVEFCRKYGLEFDSVNENLPELMEIWGNDPRKVAADVYIDDKAVMKPKYHVPYRSTQR
nr:MAG TPA: nucleotidase 5'-nucleotidase [Caudoviricetes sp.]